MRLEHFFYLWPNTLHYFEVLWGHITSGNTSGVAAAQRKSSSQEIPEEYRYRHHKDCGERVSISKPHQYKQKPAKHNPQN
jgi:hypothetical protein